MKQIRNILLLLLALGAPVVASAASITQTIQYNGASRQYLLYVPSCYIGAALPLVITLHGDSGNASGAQVEKQSGFSYVAEQQCFIAAYPYAVRGIWDNNADVGFVQAVVSHIEGQYAIVANRRFLAGHSGGARLAGKISCAWSSAIAGLAQVSYVLRKADTRDCASAPAKPVLVVHGTADPSNPYEGDPATNQLSAVDSAKFWADKYGAGVAPFVSEFNLRLDNAQTAIGQLSSWAAPVKLYTLTNGGHPFPSSNPIKSRSSVVGATVTEIGNETLDPGANVIWTFFRAL